MAAEIAYLDESYDDTTFCMSALIVAIARWQEAFDQVKEWRRSLRDRYGIFVNKELHATDFIAGRGRLGHDVVPKAIRALVFHEAMELVVGLPDVAVISGAWSRMGYSHRQIHTRAFRRILERLNTRARYSNGHILMIADAGRAEELRRVSRRSKVYNPVGSQYGAWEDGSRTKNIPNDRLIEDPFFRESSKSYFLQLADFIAFALLKSEVLATRNVRTYKLDAAYDLLEPICVKVAHRRDIRGLGIVRV